MSFFVASMKSSNGNLGGLTGADKRGNDLAVAAGVTGKTRAAYLSADTGGPGGTPVNAKDRTGTGPWYNAKGVMIAQDLTALHTRKGTTKRSSTKKARPSTASGPTRRRRTNTTS